MRRVLGLPPEPSSDTELARISTTRKLASACKVLQIPIFATTQSTARLGPICSELEQEIPPAIDKTSFSMIVPELREAMQRRSDGAAYQVAIVGIESHICVSQTALDVRKGLAMPTYLLC